jgi:ABC-type branched-subunit amino acid transport system ATPase component
MAESLLAIEALSAGYGDVRVLWGIDLCVERGEIACIVGPNGAGKTTLLRSISGLLSPASTYDFGRFRTVSTRAREGECELGTLAIGKRCQERISASGWAW